jgi:hypothetical protein
MALSYSGESRSWEPGVRIRLGGNEERVEALYDWLSLLSPDLSRIYSNS